MSDQHDRTARAAHRRPHRRGVVGDGVQMVLRRDHFIAVGDQQLDDLAETGSVGPQAMCEDNAGFAGHAAPPRTVTSLSDARMFGRRAQERTGELAAGSVGEFKPLRVFFNLA